VEDKLGAIDKFQGRSSPPNGTGSSDKPVRRVFCWVGHGGRRAQGRTMAVRSKLTQGELVEKCMKSSTFPIVDIAVNLTDKAFDKVGSSARSDHHTQSCRARSAHHVQPCSILSAQALPHPCRPCRPRQASTSIPAPMQTTNGCPAASVQHSPAIVYMQPSLAAGADQSCRCAPFPWHLDSLASMRTTSRLRAPWACRYQGLPAEGGRVRRNSVIISMQNVLCSLIVTACQQA
jgi:hypothetical protein